MIVEISAKHQAWIEQEIASGHFKDSSALVQSLLESAMRKAWVDSTTEKVKESLREVENGDVTPWRPGDAVRLGGDYLSGRG